MGGSKLYGVNIYGYKPLLAGGLGSSPKIFLNMTCSRNDSRPILGLLKAIVTERL